MTNLTRRREILDGCIYHAESETARASLKRHSKLVPRVGLAKLRPKPQESPPLDKPAEASLQSSYNRSSPFSIGGSRTEGRPIDVRDSPREIA